MSDQGKGRPAARSPGLPASRGFTRRKAPAQLIILGRIVAVQVERLGRFRPAGEDVPQNVGAVGDIDIPVIVAIRGVEAFH